MKRRVSWSGFTVVDLLSVLVVVVIAALLVAILLPTRSHGHRHGRTYKDQTQVRGIMQGLVVWAQNNNDRYPLPSLLDTANATVQDAGAAKDTTSNIFSTLVYHGFVPVEMFVSPAESNPNIMPMTGYQTDRPAAAADPDRALWDPAFSSDFTSPQGGHVSYAHLIPHGQRLQRWSNTFTSTEAALGNRGPQVASVTKGKGGAVTPNWAIPSSNTLLIHGSKTRWEGQVGFNDNHVEFSLKEWVEGGSYTGADGQKWTDLIFYDEPDDATGSNTFLGIFTRAGPERKDFKAIWD